MAGDTFYVALVRRWPRLADRIIVMTGDTFAEQDHWPHELRCRPLLLKPFTLDVLRTTVQQALERQAPGSQRASNGPA